MPSLSSRGDVRERLLLVQLGVADDLDLAQAAAAAVAVAAVPAAAAAVAAAAPQEVVLLEGELAVGRGAGAEALLQLGEVNAGAWRRKEERNSITRTQQDTKIITLFCMLG